MQPLFFYSGYLCSQSLIERNNPISTPSGRRVEDTLSCLFRGYAFPSVGMDTPEFVAIKEGHGRGLPVSEHEEVLLAL